jgi:hypothetical protein
MGRMRNDWMPGIIPLMKRGFVKPGSLIRRLESDEVDKRKMGVYKEDIFMCKFCCIKCE